MSLEETDAALRRQYLIFIAKKLSERDRLLDELTQHLRQIAGTKFGSNERMILRELKKIDGLLMQSRFTRAISNATWFDHAVANVVGFATARMPAFLLSVLNFTIFGYFSYLVITGRIFPGLSLTFNMVIGIASANAASFDVSNPEHVKAVIVLGIASLLGFAFIFFAGAACLSGNGDTRKRCWEFVKHMSTFLLGIMAGYFGHPV